VRAGEAAREVVEALRGGPPVAEIVIVRSDVAGIEPGARMLVWEDRTEGSLGAEAVDAEAVARGRASLVSRTASTKALPHEGGEVAIFVEPHHAPDELVIVGAGHIARPLCRVGAMLGYRVTVIDDRPGFATQERFPEADRLLRVDFSDPFRGMTMGRGTHLVLVTRGHKYDYDALHDVLHRGLDLAYIGMVGSQRRVRAALEQLVKEGIPIERLERVNSPVGLDIEAETPEEIAISIAAELILIRRGGTGVPLRDRARVVERWIRPK
jgi:xanthine dehydrogenase accessory factor